jgi:CTP:phosphocholine cytidylyltransferase-like protein
MNTTERTIFQSVNSAFKPYVRHISLFPKNEIWSPQVVKTNVFISNLPLNISERYIMKKVEKYGKIKHIEIKHKHNSCSVKISFFNQEDAEKLITNVNNTTMYDNVIKAKFSKNQPLNLL